MKATHQSMVIDRLPVEVFPDSKTLGEAAARHVRQILQETIESQGHANIILATGNSQQTFYNALRKMSGIEWQKVFVFHMDEYLGIRADHPASFRRYLHEKIIDWVQPAAFYGIIGDAEDIPQECARYAELLRSHPADLCCLGIGENGHLAFNDPSVAQIDDPALVKVVKLERSSRLQQVGEGHFVNLLDVPEYAISLTIPALLSAEKILAIVPDLRKAAAVNAALSGPITMQCPASILRTISKASLYLDVESYSMMTPAV